MKNFRKFMLLTVVTFYSSVLFGQNFISINSSNPGISVNKNDVVSFTSDPCAELDLGYDFHDYTFDWWEATGTYGSDWISYNETCTNYGGGANFVFYTDNPTVYPYYRRVVFSFEPWWGVYWGDIIVDVN